MTRILKNILIILITTLSTACVLGQGDTCSQDSSSYKKIDLTSKSENENYYERTVQLYDRKGKLIKEKFFFDSTLVTITKHEYDSLNRLVESLTLSVPRNIITSKKVFEYDKNGKNNTTLIQSYRYEFADSAITDTIIYFDKYIFERDSLGRFTERNLYNWSTESGNEENLTQTTKQKWISDKQVDVTVDWKHGKTEKFTKFYDQCNHIKTVFQYEDGSSGSFVYETIETNQFNEWKKSETYYLKNGKKELVNTQTRIIEYF